MALTIPTNAYCTVSDVQGMLPNRRYDGTSKPTMSQVELFCKQIAAEINGLLRGLGFSVPLTDANDLVYLQMMNQLGVAYLCESATLVGVQGKSEIAEQYQAQYNAMKKDVANGVVKFSGAGATPSSEPEGNTDLIESGTRSDPIFAMSEDQRERQF